jgi:hypothetical protein
MLKRSDQDRNYAKIRDLGKVYGVLHTKFQLQNPVSHPLGLDHPLWCVVDAYIR